MLEFFNSSAGQRDHWKKINQYYWTDLETLCSFLIPEDASVLEVGCGTGDLISHIKAARKTGIDFSPNMIEIARRKYPDADFAVMSAEDITIDETYDYIVLSGLIGYLGDIQKVFQSLQQVCHARTRVIITYHNLLWQPVLNLGEKLGLRMKQPVQNWLSRADIQNLLFLAGFDAYKSGDRLIIPRHIPIVSTLVNRYVARLPFFRKLCLTNYFIARINHRGKDDEYSVSVIVPARNESGNIENIIKRIPEMGRHTEIIFVEGHSTDDTWLKIQEVSARHRDARDIKIGRQDGVGKGDAVRKGFELAGGDILIILDADLTVPPEDLPKFYEAIAGGKGEFMNGSRLVYNMDKQAMRSLNILGNKFFSLMFSWILDQRLKDTLCGTKALFKKDYEQIKRGRKFFGDFDPFGDFDLIFGASKLNLKIIEVPIRYKERTYGRTNIRRFKHGLLLLKMCIIAARKLKFS
jgi:SAM-dependent methyltransferase